MTAGELKKLLIGVEDNTNIEIRDENTEELYTVRGTTISEKSIKFTINIQEETGCYFMDE